MSRHLDLQSFYMADWKVVSIARLALLAFSVFLFFFGDLIRTKFFSICASKLDEQHHFPLPANMIDDEI